MAHLFTHGTRGEPTKRTPIGEMPVSWEVVELGEHVEFKNGINFTSEQKGSGCLTVDVLNMYSDGAYVRMDRLYRVSRAIGDDYLLRPNDILFVRSSLKQEGIGWAALFSGHEEPVTFCGFLIRARLTAGHILPEFLLNYLRLPATRNQLVAQSGKVAILLGRPSCVPAQRRLESDINLWYHLADSARNTGRRSRPSTNGLSARHRLARHREPVRRVRRRAVRGGRVTGARGVARRARRVSSPPPGASHRQRGSQGGAALLADGWS